MKKITSIFIIAISILLSNIGAFAAQPELPPDSAYILIDSKTGQVIAERNADEKLGPASTTKIMTAIVALEKGKLDMPMTVSQEAVNDIGPGGMNVGIMAGEEGFNLETLLNVMLIKSANETANIIAENVGGTRSAFIDMMNSKAAELGATNSHFVNPCGMDDKPEAKTHLTTARDLSKMAKYAMTIPKFREIVNKEYFNDMPSTNKHDKWPSLRTTNKLLWPTNSYPYTLNGVKQSFVSNGIKTGYTDTALNNLVSSAVNDSGMELIAVVMHIQGTNNGKNVFTYSRDLLKYGFEHFSNQKLIDANQVVKTVDVSDAKDASKLDLVTASDFTCALPVDVNEQKIVRTEKIPDTFKAPINKGEILGSIQYERNGVLLGTVNVIAGQSIEKSAKANLIDSTKKAFSLSFTKVIITVLIASILFIILRFVLKRISRKRRKKSSFKL